ncbi:hypothetical protein AYL99_04406 [Fonsecaea erecta]|uniref:Ubiquitin-like domain-containing protein n=1 Tax=Fonsecaea erecta TaxID=1367422 RepID=A0A178ZSM3_9EURO|nr:hypothetical protein AYL99_04406 [Fonsecaea erecta]OAP62203.1 hypothetical protein AYL99_04406 [Fonsecaea erecta]
MATTRADTETIVALTKPLILAPDLRDCKKVGDLVSALKTYKWGSFNDMESFLYILHCSGGVEIPLNGPLYDPERPLLPTTSPILHLSARPIHLKYDVHIRLPLQRFMLPWPKYGSIRVQWTDTGRRLQERIHAQYGVPMNSFMLSFGGTSVSETANLIEQKILSDCIVSVRLSISITYRFRQDVLTSWVWSDDKLTVSLEDVAKQICTRLEDLRFAIVRCSGTVTGKAENWLPDRSIIFSADRVTGTVEENGFQTGDSIEVYRMPQSLTKRKEESMQNK